MRVLVLGAGALGVAAALHVARAGHEVVLVEREQVAGATTGLAAGLISLGVMDALDRRLVVATMAGFQTLGKTASGPLLHRPGSHVVARAPRELAHLAAIAEDLDVLGLPFEYVDPQHWARLMAARGVATAGDELEAVLSLPVDAWALSTEATTAMMRAAREAGVRFQRATAQGLLRAPDGAVRGVRLQDGAELDAERTVVAMGAWSKDFLSRSGLRLPTQCYTTHAAILSVDRAGRFPILHDHPGHYYLRPEGPNHLLVGNGTNTAAADPLSFVPVAEQGFVPDIAARVTARFPGLETARLVNAWRGILTGTPDKDALVGPHPDADGLFLAVGDNGFGFMRSWAIGAVLAHRLADAELPDPVPRDVVNRFDPARFWPDPPTAFPVTEGYSLPPET